MGNLRPKLTSFFLADELCGTMSRFHRRTKRGVGFGYKSPFEWGMRIVSERVGTLISRPSDVAMFLGSDSCRFGASMDAYAVLAQSTTASACRTDGALMIGDSRPRLGRPNGLVRRAKRRNGPVSNTSIAISERF